MGSDHCPISGELFDEIYEEGHKLSLFKESSLTTPTPKLCAKNLARFSGNQQTLKSFFTKQDIREKETQETNFEVSKISDDEKIPTKIKTATSMTPSISLSDMSEGLKEQVETERKTESQNPVKQVQKAKLKPSKLIKEISNKSKTKSKSSSSSSNQASLMSFFKKTAQGTLPERKLELVNESEERIDLQSSQGDSINLDSISDSSNSPEESLDDMLNNIEYECTEISSENNKKEIQSQWSALFKPRPIPKCIEHGESCKEYTVNKPGINQGRRFYLCSR